MIFRKEIFSSILIVFLTSNFALADDDIFEQIGKELEKPKPIQEQGNYFSNLFNAMINKDSYILYKELYLSSRYSTELGQAEGRNSVGFILFRTFSGPEGQIGDLNLQFRAASYNDQFDNGEKVKRDYTDHIDDYN